MLLQAPVVAAAEAMLVVPASPSAAATTGGGSIFSGGAAAAGGSIAKGIHPDAHPIPPAARRVLRVLLWPARQVERQRQMGRAATSSSSASTSTSTSAQQHPHHHHHHQHQQRPLAAARASPALPEPSQQHQQQQQPQHQQPQQVLVTLHSAASLPPPTPPNPSSPSAAGSRRGHRHHHHRRRQDAAAAAAAAVSVAATTTTAIATATATATADPPRPPSPPARAWTPLRSLLRLFLHHSHRAARGARPQGPGCNDTTPLERAVNVLTSLPFLAVGLHVLRTRRAPAARRFGRSFVAVGCVAGAYHACPRGGPMRGGLRKLDYYSIAWSSSILREAVFGGRKLPPWLALAACVATPLKPTLVTGANLAAIELRYAQAAFARGAPPHMRSAWCRHIGAAGVGLACFLVEDAAVIEQQQQGAAAAAVGGGGGGARFNAFHGVWHLLSAAALGLANALLGHVEEAFLLEAAEAVALEGRGGI